MVAGADNQNLSNATGSVNSGLLDDREVVSEVLNLFPGSSVVSSPVCGGPGGDGVSRDSYPCSSSTVTFHMKVRRCSCRSAWCPLCGQKVTIENIVKRLSGFDYRRTRHVSLTLSRERLGNGQEAYEYVEEKKLIPSLIKNLKRTYGREILDWLWVRGWHRDGFPHWHLFIEVEEEGTAGMIGQEVIHRYWGEKDRIYEEPIYSERHWRNLIGYFGKHGYFEKGKGHQGCLPEWALDYGCRIRRYGAMVLPVVDGEVRMKGSWHDLSYVEGRKLKREWRTYRVIIGECGAKSNIVIEAENFVMGETVNVPYSWFKALGWNYEEGKGLVREMRGEELKEFLFRNSETVDMWLKVEEHEGWVNGSDNHFDRVKRELVRGKRLVYGDQYGEIWEK